MQFTDEELRNLSGFLNKMVLPTDLVVMAENLKSYFAALDSVATETNQVQTPVVEESAPAETVVPEVIEAPVETPVEVVSE